MKIRSIMLALILLFAQVGYPQGLPLMGLKGIHLDGGGLLIVLGDVKLHGQDHHLNGTIEVTGNWKSNPGTEVFGEGRIFLKNQITVQKLNFSDVAIPGLGIDCPNGVFLDSSGVTIRNQIDFYHGHLYLGNHDLVIGPGASINGSDYDSHVVTNGTGSVVYQSPGNSQLVVGPTPNSYATVRVQGGQEDDPVKIRAISARDLFRGQAPESSSPSRAPVALILQQADTSKPVRELSLEWAQGGLGQGRVCRYRKGKTLPLELGMSGQHPSGKGDFTPDVKVLSNDTLVLIDLDEYPASNREFAVHPVPSGGTIHWSLPPDFPNAVRVKAMDLHGRVVWHKRWKKSAEPRADLGHLPEGVYFLHLELEDGTEATSKFILTR